MHGSVPQARVQVPVAAPAGSDGFIHVVHICGSTAAYLAGITRFVRAAVNRGEAVLVAVPGWRIRPLRQALRPESAKVVFMDMAEIGRNPSRIIPAIRVFAQDSDSARVSAVSEPAWQGRSARELLETAKHEALANLAFAGTPLSLLCLYDASTLSREVLATARQTHPLLAGPEGHRTNWAYLGRGRLPPPCLDWFPEPLQNTERLRYEIDLGRVRALIRRRATMAGLSADRAADLVTAVNELAANTVRHTRQGGALRIWETATELVCEICDRGQITEPLAGRRPPPVDTPAGRGLWVVNQVCDLVEMRTDAAGTIIRLHMNLRPGAAVARHSR